MERINLHRYFTERTAFHSARKSCHAWNGAGKDFHTALPYKIRRQILCAGVQLALLWQRTSEQAGSSAVEEYDADKWVICKAGGQTWQSHQLFLLPSIPEA
jgi:hypothetical protein